MTGMDNIVMVRQTRMGEAPFILFHGTTLPAALDIRDDGWQVRPSRTYIEEVAANQGLDPDAIWDEIDGDVRGFATARGRGHSISFATNFGMAAHRWAQRAPEARREALRAAWRLRNPRVARNDVRGIAWILAQMLREDPAVLEVTFSYSALRAHGSYISRLEHPDVSAEDLGRREFDKSKVDLSKMFHQVEPLPDDRGRFEDRGLVIPEVAVPLPLEGVQYELRLHRCERQIPANVYALWLNLTPATFGPLARKGQLGPSGSQNGPHSGPPGNWWPLSTVERTLRKRGLSLPWIPEPS